MSNQAAHDQAFRWISDPSIQLVSFDVFDTLIRRRLAHPDHLFAFLQNQCALRLAAADGCPPSWVSDLRHARIHAWHLALHRARLQGRDEVSLSEIYAVLGAILPGARPHLDVLQGVELELESLFIEPHPPGLQLLRRAQELGKPVVLCSDQYMPRAHLEALLHRCGIQGYRHFFLSSELGVLKATGRLYEWLVIRTGVRRDRILHIGDNPGVDGDAARRAGLRTQLVPCVLSRHDNAVGSSALLRHPSLCSVAFALHFGERADVANQPFSSQLNLGYGLLGPLLVELCRWIAQRLEQGELDRIWFLARDGQVVHRAFLELYPQLASRVAYVWASRKLLVYGTTALEPEEVLRHYNHCFDPATAVPLQQALLRIFPEIPADALQRAMAEQGLNPQMPAGPAEVLPLLRRLNAFQIQHPPERIQRLRRYLEEQAGGARSIGLFDIGWRANLQRGIESILASEPIQFTGLYFGQIFEDQLLKPLVRAESFAFNLNFPLAPFERIAPRQWLIEPLFAGTHPSVVSIRRDAAGAWEPVYEQRTPAVEQQLVHAQHLQQEALQFIHDAKRLGIPLLELASRTAILEALQEFLERPTRFDVQAYLDAEWMVGIDQHAPERFVQPLPAPPRRPDVEQALEASLWKEGFRVWHGPQTIDAILRQGQRRARLKRRLEQRLRATLKRPLRWLRLV